MPEDIDWIEIPHFEFEFRGVSGSFARFVATHVLSKHVVSSAVVAFEAAIEIRASTSSFRQEFSFADYNGVFRFRNELNALQSGKGGSAVLSGAGFSMTIESHAFGAREGLLVHGYCSSIIDMKFSPWPRRKHVGDLVLLDKEDAACLRFAIRSSLANPISLDATLTQVNALIRYLRDEGYKD